LLRDVPLWRVCTSLLLGAVGGTLVVWAATDFGASFWGPTIFPVAAGLGALVASLRLRSRVGRVHGAEA
jgi:hypothetical protein